MAIVCFDTMFRCQTWHLTQNSLSLHTHTHTHTNTHTNKHRGTQLASAATTEEEIKWEVLAVIDT